MGLLTLIRRFPSKTGLISAAVAGLCVAQVLAQSPAPKKKRSGFRPSPDLKEKVGKVDPNFKPTLRFGGDLDEADQETMKIVNYVLGTPTGRLDPESVPEFFEIDPKKLPVELWDDYCAKRIELDALYRIAQGKKKPPIRKLDEPVAGECKYVSRESGCPMDNGYGHGNFTKLLKNKHGFEPVTQDEVYFISDKTKCTECELHEEFSLWVNIKPGKKKKVKGKWTEGKPKKEFLLHPQDPLWALVGKYRDAKNNPVGGTNFFGTGFSGACRN